MWFRKKLYDFYDNPDFHFLFEDICKKEGIDNNFVDLNIAFQTASTFGLLTLIQDSDSDIKYLINVTEEEAIKISSEFDHNEIIAMNKLCDELNYVKKSDKPLVLAKSKKRNLSTHTIWCVRLQICLWKNYFDSSFLYSTTVKFWIIPQIVIFFCY